MWSKVFKLTPCWIVAFALLTGCSQAAQEASTTPPDNTPKAETRWDTMKWDEGKWE